MPREELSSIGLFAGIGGIELGLQQVNFHPQLLCEINPDAKAVLRSRFPSVKLTSNVKKILAIPKVDVLAAGFPCQDLSSAGKKAGIDGAQSSLVSEVFRLCQRRRSRPKWLILENVSFMLRLDKGRAVTQIVRELEDIGFQWGYRVVDARSFGIPQRRQRVLFVASATEDVRHVLFADEGSTDDFDDKIGPVDPDSVYGFYWTEGFRGLGWVKNAVPPIKSTSSLGIPSPPAVWIPDRGFFGMLSIEGAERLQGFLPGWTEPAMDATGKVGNRWRLVGNAVCVPMMNWLGSRLVKPGKIVAEDRMLNDGDKWPTAAWGAKGKAFAVDISMKPLSRNFDLRSFLASPLQPLSLRGASGFLSRARRSNLRFSDGFLDDLERYVKNYG